MAHHSSDRPFHESESMKAIKKALSDTEVRRALETTAAFGPTDRYPDGKMAPHDEGEIRFGVARQGDKIIIDFGTPVHSLGLTCEQACELGRLLITRAGRSCTIGFGAAG